MKYILVDGDGQLFEVKDAHRPPLICFFFFFFFFFLRSRKGHPRVIIKIVLQSCIQRNYKGGVSDDLFSSFSIKHCRGYSLEAPRRGAPNVYLQHMF